MPRLIYLGDEVSAAGWRLAGVDARVCAADAADAKQAAEAAAAALASARRDAALVLVSAALARRLDPATLSRSTSALVPLVLVVPDRDGAAALPDLAARLRLQLGLDA
jgi:vacuolar-type H+-ATPase subunit F/Vma7